MAAAWPFSSGEPVLTETEATWLPPDGGSQLRDSAGITPDFALRRYPERVRGAAPSYLITACDPQSTTRHGTQLTIVAP